MDAVREGRSFLQAAAYGELLAVCTHDAEGEIHDATGRFVSLLGVERVADLIGRNLFDFYINASDPAHLLSLLEVGSLSEPVDVCLRRKDGRLTWVLQMSCFASTVGRARIITSFTDITERKVAELLSAERAHARAMLAEVITGDLLDSSHLESIIASFKGASAPLTPPEQGGLPEAHHQLSPRELQVLVLTGRGNSLKEIASELGISLKSVSTYRSRIAAKLGLKSTADLIAYVLRYRLN